jgi:hypothetical protein
LPNGDSVDNAPDNLPGPASSQLSASANHNSSSRSYNRHIIHNMSTLTYPGASTSSTRNATVVQSNEQLPCHVALIPRSALKEGSDYDQDILELSLPSDTQCRRSVNVDIPLGAQASMLMEVTHNGKVTELVARFESYIDSGLSDPFQVFHKEEPQSSESYTDNVSICNVGTVRGPLSPRKPIPTQWLSPNRSPNLATAERAKNRGYKRYSANGSPVETKCLRGTRSLVDIRRGHDVEVQSYLTKDALAAVESDLTSSSTIRSSTKHQRASSKPAWNSPVTSPLHESLRQKPALAMNNSPTKKISVLSTLAGSQRHRRGSSSVATSTGDSVYHSAESSPVRDTADLTLSFKSTAETLLDDDNDIPHLQLSANFEDEQAVHKRSLIQTSAKVSPARGRGVSTKPQLKLDIPVQDPCLDASSRSGTSHLSATSSSGTSPSLWSPASVSSISRIPRVSATHVTKLAQSPTRSPALNLTQCAKTLTSQNTTSQQPQGKDLCEIIRSSTPPTASVRHVRTVNSSGTTPISSRQMTPDRFSSPGPESIYMDTDVIAAQHAPVTVAHVARSPAIERSDARRKLAVVDSESREASSRAPSSCTIKATSAISDPVMVDSAIIYSKKLGASGTSLDLPINVLSIVVVMAYDCHTGTFRQDDACPDTTPKTFVHAYTNTCQPPPVRGRAEQFVPTVHHQAESEHSFLSSLGSDLRATAPEFIPLPQHSVNSENTKPPPVPQPDSSPGLLGSMAFELDMHGIPWFYYMYQVQTAYNQGFQNGRSKSPKKFRQKKQRSSVSLPPNVDQPNWPTTEGVPDQEPRCMSAVPPSASTIPLAEQQTQMKRGGFDEDVVTSTATQHEDGIFAEERIFSPFAAQKEIIARQTSLHNTTNTPLAPNVDLTTIRNVPLPHERRTMPPRNGYYNTVANRGRHNNNRRYHNRSDNGLYQYRGRGTVGVPIHKTVPFPIPTPPQGRPSHSTVGSEACGLIDIIIAAERGGGQACHNCEPDHPLE